MPNPSWSIPLVSKEYKAMVLIIIFLTLLIVLRVEHERKRRYAIKRHPIHKLVETVMGIIVVLSMSWLVLSTAEAFVEVGGFVDGGSVDTMMFGAGLDCGDAMVWKDILEWGVGEISCWGGGNWIDEKVKEIVRPDDFKDEDGNYLPQEEMRSKRFSRIKSTNDWLVGGEEEDLQDFLKLRELNRDFLKGEDVIKCVEEYGAPEEVELVREIGPNNISELQRRKFV